MARRAGVQPEDVDRLVELGILKPGTGDASAGDVRRARWVFSLVGAGVPLDDMAAAKRYGALSFSFLDASAFDQFAGLSSSTFRELSADTGIPLELLMVVREALGFAEPRPEDQVRVDELSIVPVIELQLSYGFRPSVIERWLRSCGDNLRRIVETEADWYKTEVVQPLLEAGMTEGEMLEAQADVGSRLVPLTEQALLAVYHGQQEHTRSQSFVESVEGLAARSAAASSPRSSVNCVYPVMSRKTTAGGWRNRLRRPALSRALATLVRRSSQKHGGQPVKWLGDSVMFYFPNPGPGVLAALDMVEGVAAHALPPAHVGIHAGRVVFQEGDYFGRTVNIAARIAEYARPGEVLVSHEVVDAVDGGAV